MTHRIHILGLCPSPRQGNSEFLLDKALEIVSGPEIQIKRFSLGRKPLAPCDACGAHKALKGECRIKDAFQEMRDLWLEADIIIYSFPVYHMGIPGQLKAFLDRLGNSLGYYFPSDEPPTYGIPRLMKTMGFITQGAHLYGGQDLALSYMLNHAVLMRCIPVSGDLPDSYVGAGGWTAGYPGQKSLQELHGQGDRDSQIAVRGAQQVVRRALETALIIKAGLEVQKRILASDRNYGFALGKLSGD
jgi:multimeric flavodoxin WrbA